MLTAVEKANRKAIRRAATIERNERKKKEKEEEQKRVERKVNRNRPKVRKIMRSMYQNHLEARKIEIENILQPGLLKEFRISEALNHDFVVTKRGADARGKNGENYEYLCCTSAKGATAQFDRMYKDTEENLARSLKRINRNDAIFIVIFYKEDQYKIKVIYEIDPPVMEKAAIKKIKKCKSKETAHIGFSEKWASKNGTIVYEG